MWPSFNYPGSTKCYAHHTPHFQKNCQLLPLLQTFQFIVHKHYLTVRLNNLCSWYSVITPLTAKPSATGCFTELNTKRQEQNVENLYTTLYNIRVIKSTIMRWVGHVECTGQINAYSILVVKPEGKRLLGRPMQKWKDNIRINLRDMGWEGVDWMHLPQDRDQWWDLVNVVMNLQVL